EHLLDLAPRLGEQVQVPQRRAGVWGQGDIDAIALEAPLQLACGELLGALLDRLLERPSHLVGRPAGGRALLRGELGDSPEQIRQLGLPPQEANARLLERVAVLRGRDRPLGFLPDLRDALGHRAAILVASSYSARVVAIAAFREWVRIGMWAIRSACSTTSLGNPSRSEPISRLTA